MDHAKHGVPERGGGEKSADAVYFIGVRLPEDGRAAAETARKTAAAVFESMDSVTQLIVLLYFYDKTYEETIARMLRSPPSAVRRQLLIAHASFERALAAADLGVSCRDVPQLIFEALDELIRSSPVLQESVARVRELLLENN